MASFIIATVALHAPALAATSPSVPQLTRASSPFGPENTARRLDNRSVQSPVFGFACKTLWSPTVVHAKLGPDFKLCSSSHASIIALIAAVCEVHTPMLSAAT